MNNNGQRVYLKAQRSRSRVNNNCNSQRIVPSSVGNRLDVCRKRKHEEESKPSSCGKDIRKTDSVPLASCTARFSANDRLNVYRKRLKDAKGITKVHTVLSSVSDSNTSSCQSISGSSPLLNKSSSKRPKIDIQNENRNSNNSILNDDDVEMDWSPINEADIISNIQKFRQETNFENAPSLNTSELPASGSEAANKELFVVIDTNVFLANLNSIQNLMNIKAASEVIVMVPWIVIQELDYMKDGRFGSKSIQPLASKAIKFIHGELVTNPHKFKGQTVQDALMSKFSSSSADDSILNCCLQLQERKCKCVLLSNDTNLRNKVMINGLQAFSVIEAFYKISGMVEDNHTAKKVESAETALGNLFSFIIIKEMQQCYGVAWHEMKFMEKPPWSFEKCLQRIRYYWNNVYKNTLQKQALKVVEDLVSLIKEHQNVFTSGNFKLFIDLSMALCCFFKNGYLKYSKNIETCVKQLEESVK